MLATLVLFVGIAIQEPAPRPHPDDPLHLTTILEIRGPGGRTVDGSVAHTGRLHVWACSRDLDPVLRLQIGEGDVRED